MGFIQWLASIKYFLYVRHCIRYFILYSSLQSYVLTPQWPNEDGGRLERKRKNYFIVIARTLGNGSLFSWLSGPNAISVSLSPMGRYVMVGLASRRILLHPSTEHMVAQVFRLQQAHGGETSMRVSVIAWASAVWQLS